MDETTLVLALRNGSEVTRAPRASSRPASKARGVKHTGVPEYVSDERRSGTEGRRRSKAKSSRPKTTARPGTGQPTPGARARVARGATCERPAAPRARCACPEYRIQDPRVESHGARLDAAGRASMLRSSPARPVRRCAPPSGQLAVPPCGRSAHSGGGVPRRRPTPLSALRHGVRSSAQRARAPPMASTTRCFAGPPMSFRRSTALRGSSAAAASSPTSTGCAADKISTGSSPS